jgi:hypothetical protein
LIQEEMEVSSPIPDQKVRLPILIPVYQVRGRRTPYLDLPSPRLEFGPGIIPGGFWGPYIEIEGNISIPVA